jgi:uncharacterized protein (DUF983 family)
MSTKRSHSLGFVVHKLLVGLFLRCPNCEKGRVFRKFFQIEQTCSECGVRYERLSGESVGGMYINLALAEVLSVGGYFLMEILFDFPVVPHLVFWIVFNIAFVLLFYRHSRSMWVAVTYLSEGLRRD